MNGTAGNGSMPLFVNDMGNMFSEIRKDFAKRRKELQQSWKDLPKMWQVGGIIVLATLFTIAVIGFLGYMFSNNSRVALVAPAAQANVEAPGLAAPTPATAGNSDAIVQLQQITAALGNSITEIRKGQREERPMISAHENDITSIKQAIKPVDPKVMEALRQSMEALRLEMSKPLPPLKPMS